MNSQRKPEDQSGKGFTRRRMLIAGGTTLIGATLLAPLLEAAIGQTISGQDMRRRGITGSVAKNTLRRIEA
ncbi:MAG: hypothetical protein ICV60_13270 [Pyrinomonadaceae bacterium]|nr:hypothetical protein [Pyrinomonadaceae bacterium]